MTVQKFYALKKMRVTVEEGLLLSLLSSGAKTPKFLTSRTGFKSSNLSRIMGRLHRAGVISRDVHGPDRRCVIVSLTPAGRGRVKAIERILSGP